MNSSTEDGQSKFAFGTWDEGDKDDPATQMAMSTYKNPMTTVSVDQLRNLKWEDQQTLLARRSAFPLDLKPLPNASGDMKYVVQRMSTAGPSRVGRTLAIRRASCSHPARVRKNLEILPSQLPWLFHVRNIPFQQEPPERTRRMIAQEREDVTGLTPVIDLPSSPEIPVANVEDEVNESRSLPHSSLADVLSVESPPTSVDSLANTITSAKSSPTDTASCFSLSTELTSSDSSESAFEPPRPTITPTKSPEVIVLESEGSEDEIQILENIQPPNQEQRPVEVIDYIQILEEDELDAHYKDVQPNQMKCQVCDRRFQQRQPFIVHHRRHISIQHFQCTTCELGFTTLGSCVRHEVAAHQKKLLPVNSSHVNGRDNITLPKPTDKDSANATDSAVSSDEMDVGVEEDRDEEENFWLWRGQDQRSIPSNCLLPYRGPPVNHMLDAFEIENKFGERGRDLSSATRQIRSLRNRYLIIGDPYARKKR